MTNINQTTGIRFGVMQLNNLNPDVSHELMYGSQAKDHSWEECCKEAKAEAERDYERLLAEAEIAAAETGADRECDFDREAWEEQWLESRGADDREAWVESRTEALMEGLHIEEPVIGGEMDGVKYQVDWLGGAPLLFVFESPHIVEVESLCSICVPNAGNLDSLILPANRDGFQCYGVPQDWLHISH